ncbi:hypothetical protein [Pseudaquabacterium pictum]|nr:hypothetical protein [Rubrivivax pictus]
MNTTPTSSNSQPAKTIGELITAFQAESGLSDDEIAAHLGYTRGNIIAMFRLGAMCVPWSKFEPLAELMDVDPQVVLELSLRDRNPDLLAFIKSVQARFQITPAERRLIDHCRTLAGGRAVSPFIIDGRSVVALVVK